MITVRLTERQFRWMKLAIEDALFYEYSLEDAHAPEPGSDSDSLRAGRRKAREFIREFKSLKKMLHGAEGAPILEAS